MKQNLQYDSEKLGKIVQMAKNGIGGEKENAIRIVKAMCIKYHLEYDDLMSDQEKIYEYTLYFKTKEEEKLACQIIIKFAYEGKKGSISGNSMRKVLFFNTTKELYLETMNAWAVLSRLLQQEKRKVAKGVYFGFLEKHDLYYNPTDEERKKKSKDPSKSEMEARRMGSALSEHMDDAEIHKTLSSGK